MVSEGFQHFFFIQSENILFIYILILFYSKHNQQADINVTQKQENSKPDSNI